MGYGDLIMIAGVAQDLFAEHPELGPVGIRTREGKLRWRDEWLNNPAVHCPIKGAPQPKHSITAGGGYLPYLAEPLSIERGIVYSGWRACDHRGTLFLSAAERMKVDALAAPGPYLLVEPCSMLKNSNRRPDESFWHDLVDALRYELPADTRLVQLAHSEALAIPSLIQVPNTSFRDACAVLERAVCYVGTEGGLVHAAQALYTPAAVLWGGCVNPYYLGYPEHLNLADDAAPSPCGRLTPCDHCRAVWATLSPAYVAARVSAYTQRHGVLGSHQ